MVFESECRSVTINVHDNT